MCKLVACILVKVRYTLISAKCSNLANVLSISCSHQLPEVHIGCNSELSLESSAYPLWSLHVVLLIVTSVIQVRDTLDQIPLIATSASHTQRHTYTRTNRHTSCNGLRVAYNTAAATTT
jgi:hypothetical protein